MCDAFYQLADLVTDWIKIKDNPCQVSAAVIFIKSW